MGFFNIFKKKKDFDISENDLMVPEAPSSFDEKLPDFSDDEEPFKFKDEIKLPNAPKFASPIEKMETQIEHEESAELSERGHLVLKKPLFIDSNNYKIMLDDVEQVKLLLKEGEDSINRVGELELDKDKEFKKWRDDTEDIMKKLIYVDRVLFKKSETF